MSKSEDDEEYYYSLIHQGKWVEAAEFGINHFYRTYRIEYCVQKLSLKEQLSFYEKHGFVIEAIKVKFMLNHQLDEEDFNILLSKNMFKEAMGYVKQSKEKYLSKVEDILKSAFLNHEDLDELLSDAEQIYQVEGKLDEFYTVLLPKLGEIDKAIEHLKSLTNPDYPDLISLALLYEKQHKYDEAEKIYRMQGLEPLLVKFLLERDKDDEAKKVLSTIGKESKGLNVLESYLYESFKAGKHVEEYISLEEILGNYENEAQALQKLGRTEEAAKIYEKAANAQAQNGDMSSVKLESSQNKQALTCPNCGKPVDPNWKACPYCGFSLVKTPKICPKCKNEVEPEWKICPYCGEKLYLQKNKE